MTLAVNIPAAGFGLAHLYRGWRLVGWITGMSVIFGAIFVLTGSLVIVIALHIAIDVIGGLLTLHFVPPVAAPEAEGEASDPDAAELATPTL